VKRQRRGWHAALAVAAGILLAGGCDWWREYDKGFYRDSWVTYVSGWKGSDGGMSVPLVDHDGKHRTLWLFGDTFIYQNWKPPAEKRVNQVAEHEDFAEQVFPRNTVALQATPTSQNRWDPPTNTQVNYYATERPTDSLKNVLSIGENPENRSNILSYAPRSTYPNQDTDEKKTWRWPGDGIRQTSTNFNIFWNEFEEDDDCKINFMNFAIPYWDYKGTYIERAFNADTKNPDGWGFHTRFGTPNFPTYDGQVHNGYNMGPQPVALWGASLFKETVGGTTYVNIYGYTPRHATPTECFSCPGEFFQNCTATGEWRTDLRGKSVVLARVPNSSLRNISLWEYWWDTSGGTCSTPVGSCTGSSCWCRQHPTNPAQLKEVAPNAVTLFSVDKVTIGGQSRYLLVQDGTPGEFQMNTAYIRTSATREGPFAPLPAIGTESWSCSAEPCTYPGWLLNQNTPTASPELSYEAIRGWLAAGNTRPELFLSANAEALWALRIYHAQSHAHLSQISGQLGGANSLLIGYITSHFWPGDIPNPNYASDCFSADSSSCWFTQGTYGGNCRWDTEILGGRCLDDPCTQKVGSYCGFWDNCEFRGGICRVRPSYGGIRFTQVDLNVMRPWCEPNCE
jgi:hypothetical protein